MRRLRLVHPFPSLVNTSLVLGLALLAGATPLRATVLALGMLGLQFSIGALNDAVDVASDAIAKPWKPIPAGLVERRTAFLLAAVLGGGGLIAAATAGPAVFLMALAMLGCGVAYDVWLKPTRLAWACFSIAFAILPVYAWYGAAAALPPRLEFVIPLATLAGPAIQLANGLVDVERDRAANLATLAVRLGRRRAWLLMAVLGVLVHGLAWLTLALGGGSDVNLILALASGLAVLGLPLSARHSLLAREAGFAFQAIGVALLGLGWMLAVA